jgi:hypothetical protein
LPNTINRFDKEIEDNNKNIKIYLNKNKDKDKDNTDINSNKLNLNTDRSNDIYIIDNISKTMKIPKKDNSNKKNYNNNKIILPLSTGSNSITQNKESIYGIYIKPTCIMSKSKSKSINKKSKSEVKSKYDYFCKNMNIISSKKKKNFISKSLTNENYLYTPPNIFPIQDKYNLSLKTNNILIKTYKSANVIFDSSIDNNNIIKKERKKIDFDLIIDRYENNVKEAIIKKNCFFYKFYNYYLRRPNIHICYIAKQYNKNQYYKDQTIQLNISDRDYHNKNMNPQILKMNYY